MINLTLIFLLTTSLAFAGVLTPGPQKGDQIITKDGRRAVIVEYEDDTAGDGNTKVFISPPQPTKVDGVSDQLSRAAASIAGVAQEAGPRELICDAYGKCKDKLGGVLNMAKDKVIETEEIVKEKGEKGIFEMLKKGKDMILKPIKVVPLMSMMQILGFGMGFGISIWVTFIMSYVLASVLQRQQFGIVQSKIYPLYFKAMFGSVGLTLLGHLFGGQGNVFKDKGKMFQGYNLMGCLLLVLANLLVYEPKATKVMFQRMKLEKEEGRGRRDQASTPARVIDTVTTDGTATCTGTTTTTTTATIPSPRPTERDEVKTKMSKLDKRLKKLNSYSSLLNIMTLMGLTWHLVYLGHRLGGVNTC